MLYILQQAQSKRIDNHSHHIRRHISSSLEHHSNLGSFISHSQHHPFPQPQQNHPLQPLPLPLPIPLPLLLNGTSSSSSKKQAGYASAPAPTKLPKLSLQPNIAAAVVGLASAQVSSDQRLSSGFCWLAIVDPGDVDIEERAVVEVAQGDAAGVVS